MAAKEFTRPARLDITTPHEMAKQTTQAKALREARDQLAADVRTLADQKKRKRLQRLGFTDERIKELCAGADLTSADLADLLGVSLPALHSWLAPADNKKHRGMTKTASLLLGRILADAAERD